MKAIYIDDILKGWGLQTPEFSILKRDAELAHILFIQPKGILEVKSEHVHIGNEPSPDTVSKYREFFRLADSRNSHLALTPEYSCPMEVVQEILVSDVFPKAGKLWVVGAESMDKDHLRGIVKLCNENDTFLHFDQAVLEHPNEFVDPVFYIFSAPDSGGKLRKVSIVQFKSAPMGVWGDPKERERRFGLITGSEFYVMRNTRPSIHLVTLICSDSMNYLEIFRAIHEIDDEWASHPYLILHLQLNPKPSDSSFSEYRRILFSHRQNCELLCVNWARGTGEKEKGEIQPWIEFSGSSHSIISTEVNLDETVFRENYFRGCYLINCDKGRFTYYFHSDEWVFDLKTTKVSSIGGGMQPQIKRSGISPVSPFIWDGGKWVSPEKGEIQPDHRFFNEWTSMTELLQNSTSPLIIEKLIELATGGMNMRLDPSQWWKIDNISSLKQTDSESILSVTFSQDQSSESKRIRREKADNFHKIQNRLIHSPEAFPQDFKKFVANHNGKIEFRTSHPHVPPTNLSLNDGSESITVVFLGSKSEAEARDFESRFRKKFTSQNGKRLIVWYEKGGEPHFINEGLSVLITDSIPRQADSEVQSIAR